jgi:hypothetical protein
MIQQRVLIPQAAKSKSRALQADKIWSIYSFFCWQQTSDPVVALALLADTAVLRSPKEIASMDDFKQACLAANS